MLPPVLFIMTRFEDKSHSLLCKAVADELGLIIISGLHLYHVVEWVPAGDDVRRWELHAVAHAGNA